MTNLSSHRTATRSARVLACATLAAALGATLSGCGNGVESTTGTTPTRSVSDTPSPSPAETPSTATGSASAPSSPAASASGPSGPGASDTPAICPASDLRVGVTTPPGGGAAGSSYVVLTFRNTSSTTCVLDGHPGVSFVGDRNGTQLGRGADFVGRTVRTSLAPGATRRAQLRITDPGVYGSSCAPVAADGFRVYPPDSRASVFVRDAGHRACSEDLPGGRSQLSVTAVGAG